MAYSLGPMEENIKVSMLMTKKKAKESFIGQMAGIIMVDGRMVSSMESVYTHLRTSVFVKDTGKMENASNGRTAILTKVRPRNEF